jgi:transmembrane sensor
LGEGDYAISSMLVLKIYNVFFKNFDVILIFDVSCIKGVIVKYKNYILEDFLADREFIKWISNPTKESNKYWYTVIQDYPEKKEVIEDAIKLLKKIHFTSLPISQERKDRILAHTISHRYSSRAKSQRDIYFRKPHLEYFLKRAVLFLVFISLGIFLIFEIKWRVFSTASSNEVEMIKKKNPAGRKTRFYLPDGSFVTLNAESEIIFLSTFMNNRVVWLNGEAYFDVKKNESKSFLVHSKNLTVIVKGTTFNIKAFSNDLQESVSLLTGKVSVFYQRDDNNEDFEDYEGYELSPGEKLLVNHKSKQLILSDLDMDEMLWHSGTLVFKNDDINDFINKIQRWYGVVVEISGSSREKININGKFVNESLEIVLESLKFSIGIDYKIIENKVFINFPGN